MKFRNRKLDKYEWRKWFAWYPVLIRDYYYWLETVERRMYGDEWEYKKI